jgi:Cu(I)/Ag(I) efflux system membrane fusion protein
VRTEKAEKRRLVQPVRAPGVAKPDERTLHSVTLRADAFIEKLYVEETGAHVKAGEPLFRIYSPAMVSAQVDHRIADPEGDRRGRQVSIKGADQKLRNLEVPQAVIDEMRRSGEPVMSFDWPSPADGYVMKKNAIEGQMVRMGEEIFLIAGLEKIWVIADVPEQDMGLVKLGQPVTVRFKAYPSQTFEGRVTFILHELEMATRTAKVRIEIDNPDHRIKHEMYADVEIDAGAGETPRVAVPNSAIIDSGNRQVVLVARGEGRFEPRAVTPGLRGESYTEILQGVAQGEEVVVAANFLIDAESNLQAALAGFTADATPEKAIPPPPAAAPQGHEGHGAHTP